MHQHPAKKPLNFRVVYVFVLSILINVPTWFFFGPVSVYAQETKPALVLDEKPALQGEWGRRPTEDQVVAVTPPSFVWRPTANVVRWELAVQDVKKKTVAYRVEELEFNAHTPSEALKPGRYAWKYRGFDKSGKATPWSAGWHFSVPDGVSQSAKSMPMPARKDLLARIPKEHPRIFVRPEGMDRLRALAKKELAAEYKMLVQQCDRLLKNPPNTTEPPLYKKGKFSVEERDTWWGNRVKTIAVLENAATLAFTWNLDGNEAYAELAKKLLLAAAGWNPKGATGYRYNDEAGMPYNYHFSRTYSFLNSRLTEEEKAICREVMKVRGEEMYKHLCPRQLWNPYGSHQNRAWHFLGEIGLAFHGEIPEADDWTWFAMNVFFATYPAWCDDDGGWHEGPAYWVSYQNRFCWWADAMSAAFDINAFDKPYYSQIGYYAMYLAPPGTDGRALGDQAHRFSSFGFVSLIDIVATQSGNPYWRWYVEAHPNFKSPANYYSFIRKAASLDRPKVESKPPTDLPTSKVFRGTGLAMLNTNLLDAKDNVQLVFKSAPRPFGSWSHGYDPNNSYVFSAWNENLLINTGQRDSYGTPFHRDWMWSCRSENNITVDGVGQLKRDYNAIGEIVRFDSGKFADGNGFDILVGEASEGYRLEKNASAELKQRYPDGKVLDGYRRSIVFLKPDVLIVYDRLAAKAPARFDYWLHAKNPFQPLENYFPNGKSAENDNVFKEYLAKRLGNVALAAPEAAELFEPVKDQQGIGIRAEKVACRVDLLLPEGLTFTQTNQYDPTPLRTVKLREWHLTATAPKESKEMEFLMVARPWKVLDQQAAPAKNAEWERQNGDLLLRVESNGKKRLVRFPAGSDGIEVKGDSN